MNILIEGDCCCGKSRRLNQKACLLDMHLDSLAATGRYVHRGGIFSGYRPTGSGVRMKPFFLPETERRQR